MGGTKADFVTYEPDEIDRKWKKKFLLESRLIFAGLFVFEGNWILFLENPNAFRCQSAHKNETVFELFRIQAEQAEYTNLQMKLMFGIKKTLQPIILKG